MNARPGLTLVEVVVTLVVAGLAMASGYAALSLLVDRRTQVRDTIADAVAGAELRATLESWIGGAELTVEEDLTEFRGLDGHHRGVPDDALTLYTSATTAATETGSMIRLFVDRSDSSRTTGLTLEVLPQGARASRFLELDARIISLDIRYLSAHLGAPEWSNSWVSSSILPRAVEVRLAASSPDSLPALLRLPILVPVNTP